MKNALVLPHGHAYVYDYAHYDIKTDTIQTSTGRLPKASLEYINRVFGGNVSPIADSAELVNADEKDKNGNLKYRV